MTRLDDALNALNSAYLAVHTAKEDLFWDNYMGIAPDQARLDAAEKAYKAFISSPDNLKMAKDYELEAKQKHHPKSQAFSGWRQFFAAHVIEDPEANHLQNALIESEGALFAKRAGLTLHCRDENGQLQPASSVALLQHVRTSGQESVRQSAHEALLDLEQWVLNNGFIDLIKLRNRFARQLGYANFFAYNLQKIENMSPSQLHRILSDFERKTRAKCMKENEALRSLHGPRATAGYNLLYLAKGDQEKKADPYFPFSRALRSWIHSFAHLGIKYRQATLTLDLLDRAGKYENGFMHGPFPCFFDQGRWRPARINFTSNAIPGQVGSGRNALETLFHEGGHAAHFANISTDAPCFSQEFPPNSMAYAETQSMFLDALVRDGDWIARYAKTRDGRSMPMDIIGDLVTADHPFMAFSERSILLVSLFESSIYAMEDHELTPENMLRCARTLEAEILGVSPAPRPLLAVPHLLHADSACAYHGYLLANMAVYQSRSYFLKRDGYLTDNPAIGPDLCRHYWQPGYSIPFPQMIANLTGTPFSGDALANYCNLDQAQLWAANKIQIEQAAERQRPTAVATDLEAEIRITHGKERIADNQESLESMCLQFEQWIDKTYPS